jgi:type I restriction enzyme S subunit
MTAAVMLSDVAELVMGQSPPSTCYNEAGDGLPFYQGKTDFGVTYPTPRIYCSDPKKLAEDGDILMSVRAPVGATNLCKSQSCIGRGIAAIRAHGIDRDFLYFYLKRIEAYIDSLGSGAIFKAINKSQLAELPINDAGIPLPEQKKIAQILSTVQRAIDAQDRIIQTTTELKKALMHKLFTEGMRGEPQKETEIGPIPESWEVVKVQDLVDREILDKPIDGNHGEIHPKASDFVPEGIPFIMASDLKGGLVDLKTCNFLTKERADRLRKGFSLPGDVLISHKATIGETAIVPDVEHYIMLTPQVTYYRVLDKDALSNEYLRCYFDSPTFQKPLKNVAGDGSTRAYIGITKQRDLPVLLPMIEEQRELAKVFSCLDGKLRQSITKKNAFTDLFRTLLHELMTAKTRVHELDIPTLLPA